MMSSYVPAFPRPFDVSGRLVPFTEGSRGLCKAVYVDQVNGNDGQDGRSWASAKQTMFGASGAASVMASGDTVIFRAGHSEALAGPTAFALSFTKWLVEGPERIGILTPAGAPAQFTGPELLTISGNGNEFVRIGANFVVSGNENRLYECTQGGGVTPSFSISGSRNYLKWCVARLFVSGNQNIIDENLDGSLNLTGTASANIFWFPRNLTLGNDPFPCAATTLNNLIYLERGTNFQVSDLGQNSVWWFGDAPRPGGSVTEAVAPEVPTAAVTVTGGVGGGVYGVAAVILAAAAAPASDYEWLGIVAILNMVDDYYIEVQDTTGQVLGAFTANAAAVATRFSEKVLSPVRVRGGVGIQARLKTTGGGSDTATLRVKFRTV